MTDIHQAASAILAWLKDYKDAIRSAATIVASVSLIYGIIKYARTLRLQRSEWLHKLFTSFYENSRYKQIRELLDGRHRHAGETAMHAITRLGKETELDDYLNFFEFLAGLKALRQMRRKDVLALFEYWIQRLRSHHEVSDYITRFGY